MYGRFRDALMALLCYCGEGLGSPDRLSFSYTVLPGSLTPCRLPLHKTNGRHGGE